LWAIRQSYANDVEEWIREAAEREKEAEANRRAEEEEAARDRERRVADTQPQNDGEAGLSEGERHQRERDRLWGNARRLLQAEADRPDTQQRDQESAEFRRQAEESRQAWLAQFDAAAVAGGSRETGAEFPGEELLANSGESAGSRHGSRDETADELPDVVDEGRESSVVTVAGGFGDAVPERSTGEQETDEVPVHGEAGAGAGTDVPVVAAAGFTVSSLSFLVYHIF
jgi:hypothetical protein